MYYMDMVKHIEELGENYYFYLRKYRELDDEINNIHIVLKNLGLEDQVNKELENIKLELDEVPF